MVSPPCPSHCPFSPLSLRQEDQEEGHTSQGHWGPFVIAASHPDPLPARRAWLREGEEREGAFRRAER